MKEIVIDVLGSDKGASELVLGCIQARIEHPDYKITIVGVKDEIVKVLTDNNEDISLYNVIDSKPLPSEIHDVMSMLRYKEHCSVIDALEYAKANDDVAGVISAGPTGMVLVSSIRHLGLLDGVDFPALGVLLYNIKQQYVSIVDCGANIEIKEEKLFQFAKLGTALMRSYCGIESPRVGLMNVGTEDTKGDSLRKAAFPLFKNSSLNFVGNIEGNDVFMDKVDVVACDGFTGNIILKNAEAVAMIARHIALKNDEKKTADDLYNMFAYNELGGAIVIGSKKPIIKAHGAANRKTIASVVSDIVKLDQNNFIENMKKEIAAEK